MAIQQKLHTKLVQKLILTPSLQQAIKLLPMSTLELAELLNQEMVENPMLEEVPGEEHAGGRGRGAPEKPESRPRSRRPTRWDDQDYEYFFGDYLDDGYRPRAPQEVKELPPIENTLSTSTSLSDHLLWQLSMQTDDDAMREIGDGDRRQPRRRRVPGRVGRRDRVDGALGGRGRRARAPAGAGLRPDRRGRARPAGMPLAAAAAPRASRARPTEKIVTEHLRLLQNHQVPELARKLGMPVEELKQHIEIIRHLDPKPGSRYNPRSRSTSSRTCTW